MTKILLITEDPYARSALSNAVRGLGTQIHHYTEANSAIESIGNLDPDLVLIDLKTADIDGYTWDYAGVNLCRIIRSHYRRRFPVVLLTPADDPSTVAPCLAAGADDYFLKTEPTASLRERLRIWLHLASVREAAWNRREPSYGPDMLAGRTKAFSERMGWDTGMMIAAPAF